MYIRRYGRINLFLLVPVGLLVSLQACCLTEALPTLAAAIRLLLEVDSALMSLQMTRPQKIAVTLATFIWFSRDIGYTVYGFVRTLLAYIRQICEV